MFQEASKNYNFLIEHIRNVNSIKIDFQPNLVFSHSVLEHVKNDKNNGLPETQPSISVNINIEINGAQINLIKYPFYRFTDPINGEVIIPFIIVPKMTINLDQQVYIFYNSEPKQIFVSVNAHAEKMEGNLTLKIPDGWKVDPENHKINLDNLQIQKSFSEWKPYMANIALFVKVTIKKNCH